VTADLGDVPPRLRRAARAALDACDVQDGHLSVELVDSERIRELNRDHRGRDAPTDVLSFPLDERTHTYGPRELGDVFICEAYSDDVIEATVHGVLHLCGFDHEEDDGKMLDLQDEIMSWLDGPDDDDDVGGNE
jgi:probable rRNA maturation factor